MLRILVVALLALAVPVQGFAAVAAVQCMALGHHSDGGAQDGHDHGHDGVDGHDHAAHSHADKGGAEQAKEGGEPSHCGPCTACCASASISGASVLGFLPSYSDIKHVFFERPWHGIQPPGFDRPPLAL